uniref:Uncharacterized protein n=1 Tax=Anopheles coluzzii TaxID=1518534 RepID=A0A8W7P254_ANOCL
MWFVQYFQMCRLLRDCPASVKTSWAKLFIEISPMPAKLNCIVWSDWALKDAEQQIAYHETHAVHPAKAHGQHAVHNLHRPATNDRSPELQHKLIQLHHVGGSEADCLRQVDTHYGQYQTIRSTVEAGPSVNRPRIGPLVGGVIIQKGLHA